MRAVKATLLLLSLVCSAQCHYTTTVVSGYWRVSNKHNSSDYDDWFAKTLVINAPLFFFYEDEAVRRQVERVRKTLPTHYVHRPLSSFAFASRYSPAWTHELHVPSAELGKVWLEKVVCLKHAADEDMFKTAWFAWVDAGNVEYRDKPVPPEPWPAAAAVAQLPHESVVCTGNGFEHEIAGTAFLYHRDFAGSVLQMFNDAFAECAATFSDYRCGSDQIVFSFARRAHPERFCQIGIGYGAIVPILHSPSFQLA